MIMNEPAAHEPRFSVVVPTRNRRELLERALESVLAQSCQDFELLVVDDGSTDDTAEYLRALRNGEPRLRAYRLDLHRGVSAARNRAIAEARAPYITFLDDDDEWLPTLLERTRECLQTAPDSVGFCWSGVRKVRDATGEVIQELVWRESDRSDPDVHLTVGTGFGLTVRRTCFEQVGVFDAELRAGVDFELLIRLGSRFDHRAIPEPLVVVHLHDGPQLTGVSRSRAESYERILAKHPDLPRRHPRFSRGFRRKTAYLWLQLGERSRGRRHLWRNLREAPFDTRSWRALVAFELAAHKAENLPAVGPQSAHEPRLDPDPRPEAFEISVVIPVRNRRELLGRAVRSVLGQTFRDFELLIVDDGSSDRPEEALEELQDPRIRWLRQPPQGVSSARNHGAREARGRFLAFLDSDDVALPDWLANLHRATRPGVGHADPHADECAQVGIVCCGLREETADGSIRPRLPERHGPELGNLTCQFLAGGFFVLREIFEEVGGYWEELTFSENTELGFRLVARCRARGLRVVSVLTPLVVYHRRRAPFPSRHDLQRRLLSSERILDRHRDLLQQSPRAHGHLLATAAVRAARLGSYRRARGFLLRAVRTDPWQAKHWGRLLLALLPPVGRRVWHRADRVESTGRGGG